MSDDQAAIDELLRVSTPGVPHRIEHYLYFPSETLAQDVIQELRRRGFQTEDRLGADGVNWLVLARHEVVPSEQAIREARQLMESLVEHREGEYDGWEAETTTP